MARWWNNIAGLLPRLADIALAATCLGWWKIESQSDSATNRHFQSLNHCVQLSVEPLCLRHELVLNSSKLIQPNPGPVSRRRVRCIGEIIFRSSGSNGKNSQTLRRASASFIDAGIPFPLPKRLAAHQVATTSIFFRSRAAHSPPERLGVQALGL